MPQKMFEQHYKRLNKEQKLAVDSIEGPVMVVAGPGTGKTQILTFRIANILWQTDVEPENILALTFTDSAASSMRKRLAEIIGGVAYRVVINTFHGFCNDIIKKYPEEFPRIIGSRHITPADQIQIVEKLLQNLSFKNLKPFGDPMFYVGTLLSRVNDLKREAVSPEEYIEIVKRERENFENLPDLYHKTGSYKGRLKGEYQKQIKKIEKNKELAEFYRAYENYLGEQKLYDYSDMITEVLRALRGNEDLLLILEEEHQYILVDEHQDTNNAQNKILELLCSFHRNPNIFIVGDEKQAIFRFQGASLENFFYFKTLYPEAKLINLEKNYRSTQSILDSAHSLIPTQAALKSAEKKGLKIGKIKLFSFSTSDKEAHFIAKDIKEKIKKGIPPEEIAVLYRDNKDAFSIAHELEKEGIQFIIESDQELFADPDIKKLMSILRTVHEFGNDEHLIPLLHIDFLKVEPLDLYKLTREARRQKTSLYELIKEKKPRDISSTKKLHDLYIKLSSWAVASKNKDLLSFFEDIVHDSGFLKYLLGKAGSEEKLETLNSFFDEAKKITESHPDAVLEDLISYIDTIKKHGVLVKKKSRSSVKDRVRLMTVHKAKGLEFNQVYITRAFDGHFGGRRRPDKLPLLPSVFSLSKRNIEDKDTRGDERRLFYVALTRAREGVTISYAKESNSGREQLPSQFISEIKDDLIEKVDTDKFESQFEKKKDIIYRKTPRKRVGRYDKEFIRECFSKHGFSVTALNNYLDCPWKYFYMNLMRIPRAPEKYQMYGSAIHGALKDLFENLKEREVGREFLLDTFSRNLGRQPLKEAEYEEVLEKGRKTLSSYWDFYEPRLENTVLTEFKINGVLISPEIRLTGVLDKVEFLDDVGNVRVVDYKTGKPKTRNFILGKTRASNGDYYRQLVFYKLLLDRYNNGKYKMVEGVIDFVEPDDKGRLRQEKFEIDDREVKELEEEIKKVSDEILNLKFWDKRCGLSTKHGIGKKDCEYCNLREIMQ